MKRLAHALLERGIGSRLIARETGLSVQTLDYWRTRILRDRPRLRRPGTAPRRARRHASGRPYRKLRKDRRARAFLLYADGRNDAEIAVELGIYVQQVWEWRNALCLPSIDPPGRTRHTTKAERRPLGAAITPMSNALYARIISAVGRGLSPDLIDDTVSDIWLAVAEGRLSTDQLECEARVYRNRVVATFASRYGPRSPDQELGDEDGFTLMDTLKDERSRSWLEKMGATVS